MVAPQKVIQTLGADILRLWVAATDYRAEMSISDEILTRMADSYRRIRNTARYLLANLNGFDPKDLLPGDEMLALDRWAVSQAKKLQDEVLAAYESFAFHLIYQKVHQFCVVELGSFYLDILKDRMYTMPAASRGRRSAQSAMVHIAESLTRLLAPVLSFTAEEIWSYLPGKREESVFLSTWYDRWPTFAKEDMGDGFWDEVIAVRQAVSRELERLRVAGGIGSALNAEVDLYCESKLTETLARLGSELRFVFSCSETPVKGLYVQVAPSTHAKCARCWHQRSDVGSHPEHPLICGRCVANIIGAGEARSYA